MLDALGSEYVIDHIIAEHNLRTEEKVYRVYTTEALKAIAEFCGISFNYRYADLIEKAPEDPRNPDDIVLDIIARADLKLS